MTDFGRGGRTRRTGRTSLVLALGGLGLAACATAPSPQPGLSSLSAPSDQASTSARPYAGNGAGSGGLHGTDKPYQINGVWYYPHAQPDYDVVGYASWYGPGFSSKRTANGEVFDEYGLSAAHKTLPLPSIVEVTNLDNGRSIKLRLNDRGPFVDERVLDVSRAAADQLGFARQGLARVRVRYVGAAPPLAASVTYAAADSTSPPPRRALTGAALGGATGSGATGAALAVGGTATSGASATTGMVLASAALPTVSRRPSGVVQQQALAPLKAYSQPAAPVALAAYSPPAPAVSPAMADPSRYAEASVALYVGDPAPTAQAAPSMASQAAYGTEQTAYAPAAPPQAGAGARWAPPASDPPDSITSGVAPQPRPVEMASLAAIAAPLQPYAPSQPRAYAASSQGAMSGVEGYSVQAGAFSNRDNAARAAAQLGATAAIRPVDRGGLTLYRVVLAGYPSSGAAEAARAQAVAAGFADARVVSAQ